MGIFKSFDFFPEVRHLIGTVTAYFLDIGYLVDQLTVGEDRLQDAAGREIEKYFFFQVFSGSNSSIGLLSSMVSSCRHITSANASPLSLS